MYIYIHKEIDIYRCIDIYLRINNNRQQKSVFLSCIILRDRLKITLEYF